MIIFYKRERRERGEERQGGERQGKRDKREGGREEERKKGGEEEREKKGEGGKTKEGLERGGYLMRCVIEREPTE